LSRPSGGPSRERRPTASGWQSRLAAADLIERVCEQGADLETALSASVHFNRLTGPDRAFARAIASAFLRARGRVDAALAALTGRPDAQVDPAVRAFLRAGCAQLWVMKLADYASVSATVEAASRSDGARRAGGFLNAVLRRAAREPEGYDALPASSVWPELVRTRLEAALGVEACERVAALQLEEPPIDLSFRTSAAAAEFAAAGGGELLPSGSVRLSASGALSELPGYASGDWWVQDAAAALPARLLSPCEGLRALDMCAAPGGKTMQLAAAGALTTAIDISAQRLRLLRDNLTRTGLAADVIEADARQFRADRLFERVLLDAPCSALGVLRRHPEGAYRRRAEDLRRFPSVQAALLRAARDLTAPGGLLVYCVCTPSPEEGEEIVEAVLAEGGLQRAPARPEEAPGFIHALTDRGDLLTAPPGPAERAAGAIASDVFFISRLVRTG